MLVNRRCHSGDQSTKPSPNCMRLAQGQAHARGSRVGSIHNVLMRCSSDTYFDGVATSVRTNPYVAVYPKLEDCDTMLYILGQEPSRYQCAINTQPSIVLVSPSIDIHTRRVHCHSRTSLRIFARHCMNLQLISSIQCDPNVAYILLAPVRSTPQLP